MSNRTDLKHNFLDNIIIRFDFNGIFENELEKCVSTLKKTLKKNKYNFAHEEYAKEVDFKINDPDIELISPTNIRQQKVYVFHNVEDGLTFKISRSFAIINSSNKKYMSFSDYAPPLIEIINILKTITYFNITRFGIRKINICILKDITKLYNYFKKEHFYLYDKEKTQIYEQRQTYIQNQYNINLIRNIVLGKYDENSAYQIAIDADIYTLSSEQIDELLNNHSKINEMNNILFEIYISMLTKKFIKQLTRDIFVDNNLIGVVKNNV